MREPPKPTMCCGSGRSVEEIWLNVKRDDGTTGRREIGRVQLCVKCGKQIGDVLSSGKPKVSQADWKLMMQTAARKGPFYFDRREDGALVPQGFDLIAYEKTMTLDAGRKITVAPQDRAANDAEPEWEPEE